MEVLGLSVTPSPWLHQGQKKVSIKQNISWQISLMDWGSWYHYRNHRNQRSQHAVQVDWLHGPCIQNGTSIPLPRTQVADYGCSFDLLMAQRCVWILRISLFTYSPHWERDSGPTEVHTKCSCGNKGHGESPRTGHRDKELVFRESLSLNGWKVLRKSANVYLRVSDDNNNYTGQCSASLSFFLQKLCTW